MAEIEEVSDDDWLKVTPEIVAEALHVAAGGDTRKLCSQSLHDGGIWAKVAAVFKNKRSSKRDQMFLYTIWSYKRKNVEIDYKALAGKGCRATRPKPPEVTDNQRCYYEKYKQRWPGEKRILCPWFIFQIIWRIISCSHYSFIGKDESKEVDAEPKSEPLYAERKTPNFEDCSSSDDELPEDSDSDQEFQRRTRILNEPAYEALDQRNLYEPILSQEESLEPGFENKFDNRGEATDQSIPDCAGTYAWYFEEVSDDDLPDTPKVVINPSPSAKNDIQVVPELPKCQTPVVPKDDQPTKRKLIFLKKRGDDVSQLSSSSTEDDGFLPNIKKLPCKKAKATDLQGKKLDTSKVPSNFDMTITYEDWKKIVGIKPNTSGRSKKDFYLQPGYYNEIRRHFMAVNKFYLPTFTHNRLNDPESLSGNFLWDLTAKMKNVKLSGC
ncbi:unnamed protein product [Orchesella dallaii]|uniref:Uncharacterized protein n=1 Tax=Orchesella dallaii TaxID=48710 RepID=A0ABP1PWY2_9HEXA